MRASPWGRSRRCARQRWSDIHRLRSVLLFNNLTLKSVLRILHRCLCMPSSRTTRTASCRLRQASSGFSTGFSALPLFPLLLGALSFNPLPLFTFALFSLSLLLLGCRRRICSISTRALASRRSISLWLTLRLALLILILCPRPLLCLIYDTEIPEH